MRKTVRYWKLPFWSLVFLAATNVGAQTSQDLMKPDPSNWLHYSGSYDSQRHSLLKQINTGNVENLAPKWMFHFSGSIKVEAVPLVVNGVMYVAQLNHVDALDARSGRLIWQYQRQPVARGAHRGIAVSGNQVFVGTADSFLVALDARNGAVRWQTKIAGDGVRYQGGAPLVIKDKVLVGGNSRTGGFIDAYDTESGKQLWRWNVLPKPGEPGQSHTRMVAYYLAPPWTPAARRRSFSPGCLDFKACPCSTVRFPSMSVRGGKSRRHPSGQRTRRRAGSLPACAPGAVTQFYDSPFHPRGSRFGKHCAVCRGLRGKSV